MANNSKAQQKAIAEALAKFKKEVQEAQREFLKRIEKISSAIKERRLANIRGKLK